jgi:hypothetical protein
MVKAAFHGDCRIAGEPETVVQGINVGVAMGGGPGMCAFRGRVHRPLGVADVASESEWLWWRVRHWLRDADRSWVASDDDPGRPA